MERLRKLFFKNIAAFVGLLTLLANGTTVFGQAQKNPVFLDVYTDSSAAAEVNSTIFLRPVGFGELALILGTNKGKAMFANMKQGENRLPIKTSYRLFEFLSKTDSLVREINFITSSKGYLLKSDGIFFSDGSNTKWKQITSNLDFQQGQNSKAEFWGMSFVGESQRACVAGIYVQKNESVNKINKELLSCTENILEVKPRWEEARIPQSREAKPTYLTNIHFDKEKNGWAVGTDGTSFNEGIIWYSADEGRSWEEQKIETQSLLLSISKSNKRAVAVGFNGAAFGTGSTANSTPGKDDRVEVQTSILDKIRDIPGIGAVTRIIGKVKEVKDNGMLEIEVEEVLPKNTPRGIRNIIEDYFEDNPIAPKDVKKIDTGEKDFISNNWQSITLVTKHNLRSVKFSDNGDDGFIVGDKGTIYYTSDGGNNWKLLYDARLATIDLYSIFIDDQYCWIGGSKGAVAWIKYK